MLDHLRQWSDERRLFATAAIADSFGAAWAVVQFGMTGHLKPFTARIVRDDHTNEALDPLPVEALRLSVDTTSLLLELGLTTIGPLLSLPREALAERFAPELLLRLDQATGAVGEPFTPYRPAPRYAVRQDWEFGVTSAELLAAVWERMLPKLLTPLAARNRGVARLLAELIGETGSCRRLVVGLLRPSLDAKHLLDLLRLRLETVRLREPLIGTRLSVLDDAPQAVRQQTLLEDLSPPIESTAWTTLVERLSGRLGADRVVAIRPHDDHDPARAWKAEPWLARSARRRARPSRNAADPAPHLPRPTRLLPQPRPIRVFAVAPQGHPQQFDDRGRMTRVRAKLGTGADRNRLVARAEPASRLLPRRNRGRRTLLDLSRSPLATVVSARLVRLRETSAMKQPLQYAELHCLTNFSFLRAASHPDELVLRAAELGYAALAITDRHSLAGVVEAHAAAKKIGLKLLIGAEVRPVDAPACVLLATNRAGYGRLARLLTLGKSRAAKGDCLLHFADLAAAAEGLLACAFAETTAPSLPALRSYREAFGDRAYLLAETHRGPDAAARLAELQSLSKQARVPLVAAGGAYYHVPERRPLQDVLTAIRLGRPVAECGYELFANAERHLRPLEELELLYEAIPDALGRSCEVAARCTFLLDELCYEYPEELAPADTTIGEYLRRLAWEGAAKRYPTGVPAKVRGLLERELALIEQLRYEAFFLTVWDLVRFAREQGILCQGRGSAANSVVCYCLGVTAVDPEQIDVLFERFVSPDRNEPPDIDVDFEHERREEVLQYVYEKYGRERAALTAVTIRYRSRSASRDVGKALGVPEEAIETLAKTFVDHRDDPQAQWEECCRDAGFDPADARTRQFITLAGNLVGFPRHLSQHVGGMVMSRGPLCELVPIENAAMPGRTVIEWNKDDLDVLGLLKVDCLSLGMLTAIRKGFQFIKDLGGPALDVDHGAA
ncbi:MAG: PHP domain-containing protein [Pirellulales bacterium]